MVHFAHQLRRLTCINGSPRGRRSNTDVFTSHFLAGLGETCDLAVERHYMYPSVKTTELREAFEQAERVLLAFPLYVDAMPSAVKDFIDSLRPLTQRETNPEMLFFVQCGFPEAFHNRQVERYLLKLARRLGAKTPGCIVKGGGEGVKEMPSFLTSGTFKRLHKLGRLYGETGEFDEKVLKKIAGVERLGPVRRWIYRWVLGSNLGNFWWHKQMKENDCLEQDAATPYIEGNDSQS